jgi:hypothetical protein
LVDQKEDKYKLSSKGAGLLDTLST